MTILPVLLTVRTETLPPMLFSTGIGSRAIMDLTSAKLRQPSVFWTEGNSSIKAELSDEDNTVRLGNSRGYDRKNCIERLLRNKYFAMLCGRDFQTVDGILSRYPCQVAQDEQRFTHRK
jgi:hypothetical protein